MVKIRKRQQQRAARQWKLLAASASTATAATSSSCPMASRDQVRGRLSRNIRHRKVAEYSKIAILVLRLPRAVLPCNEEARALANKAVATAAERGERSQDGHEKNVCKPLQPRDCVKLRLHTRRRCAGSVSTEASGGTSVVTRCTLVSHASRTRKPRSLSDVACAAANVADTAALAADASARMVRCDRRAPWLVDASAAEMDGASDEGFVRNAALLRLRLFSILVYTLRLAARLLLFARSCTRAAVAWDVRGDILEQLPSWREMRKLTLGARRGR